MLVFFSLLVICLCFVNGWSDAPGTIAGCICTRSLSPASAMLLAAFCNLLGAIVMASLSPGVAKNLYGIANFGTDPRSAVLSICCALLSVVLWATLASLLGLPTSESHALIAALTGAALIATKSTDAIGVEEWRSVTIGLLISTLPVIFLSFLLCRLFTHAFSSQDRRGTMNYFRRVQIISAAVGAFLHGAQDSQKFIGVYMLGLSFLTHSSENGAFDIPFYVTLICSLSITLGTMIGGSRMIKKVGCELTRLDPLCSSAADTASSAFLGVCSYFGLPTATTHAKTCAIMGIGLANKGKANPRVIFEISLGWLLTFPACAFLGAALSFFAHLIFL